mmetsp:Transcript_20940/g.30183  ORF Transcript_20940/g.30183 Transcript_20940/m.30183 type:complete len:1570 (-) Transcript_20940:113-4822(-)|eukprot:CAMPEP_0185036808 /NCGR_PEP_ID=MMETSP1103-20130426/30300_1 /TAXON_ID=36769 /ORGANISM="Paraphysomonas bandaiensis, Strain Caron Lab Isolate" /LENGTH=1569 /DNA_ID=CAMNT_0027574495 /DNA_START=54 /DNA_END=4763 /DNA_ORIENTATION=+
MSESKSLSTTNNKKFPEIAVYPQQPSPYKILEPYIEFAADIEADKVRSEVMHVERMRSQTSPTKAVRPPFSRSDPRKKHCPEGGKPTTKSPRQIKTAPNASVASSVSPVRESLQDMSKHPSIMHSTSDSKSTFEKAVESLAAMKLHDYAVRRKERMKHRYNLWEEIRGTQRQMEISGAEQALLEFQEQLAAWKIKYYVQKYVDNGRFHCENEEKNNWIKQCKALKRKVHSLQKQISDYLGRGLEDLSQQLGDEKSCLETELDSMRAANSQLLEDIEQRKQSYLDLEKFIEELKAEHVKELKDADSRVEEEKRETRLAREETEVSRRTCQDYLRNITNLEVRLEETTNELNGLRSGDLKESLKLEDRIQSMQEDMTKLVSQLDATIAERNQLKEDLFATQAVLEKTANELESKLHDENDHLKENEELTKEVASKTAQISSLEKLVTEITVQRDDMKQMISEGTTATTVYKADMERLQGVIEEKEQELRSALEDVSESEKYLQKAFDRVENICIERECACMAAEEAEMRTLISGELLAQNVGYARMLESQLIQARKKEHFDNISRGGLRSAHSVTLQSVPNLHTTDSRRNVISPGPVYSSQSAVMQHTTGPPSPGGYYDDGYSFDDSLTDPYRSATNPLEGRLVSLLGLLEDKLTQLDAVVQGSEVRRAGLDEQSRETDWEEVCVRLEEKLVEEKSRLEAVKRDLGAARDEIQVVQKQKDAVRAKIKDWQLREQSKNNGILPPEGGNSAESRALFAKLDEIQHVMQDRLTEAQNIATEALNCKMECDRLQEELNDAEEAATIARIDHDRSSKSTGGSRQSRGAGATIRRDTSSVSRRTSSEMGAVEEEETDEGSFMTATGGSTMSGMVTPQSSYASQGYRPTRNTQDSPIDSVSGSLGSSAMPLSSDSYGNTSRKPVVLAPTAPVGQSARPKATRNFTEIKHPKPVSDLGSTQRFSVPPKQHSESENAQVLNFDESDNISDKKESGHSNTSGKESRSSSGIRESLPPAVLEVENKESHEAGVKANVSGEKGFDDDNADEENNGSVGNMSTYSSLNANSVVVDSDSRRHAENGSDTPPGNNGSIEHSAPGEFDDQVSLSEVESYDEMLQIIGTRLKFHKEALISLREEQEKSRGEIEKWTVFFLKEQGRVPGLAESKYGSNNQIFENFNSIQHDVYAHHQEIQELFDYLDSKRDEILRNNDSLAYVIDALESEFQDPIMGLSNGEEYEDAYKLHFESVENMLMQGPSDSDDASINSHQSFYPNGTLNFDELSDSAKIDVLENLESDIKQFQQDIADLHLSLQESRAVAEELNSKLSAQKTTIKRWQRDFKQKYGRDPSDADKEENAAALYLDCHDLHIELEEEMEKMRTCALISTAKATEVERLRVLQRRFSRRAPEGYAGNNANSSSLLSTSISQAQSQSKELSERTESFISEDRSMSYSDSNKVTRHHVRERLERAIAKMTEDLNSLNSYIANAETDIQTLRARKLELKDAARQWEEEFIAKYKRKPTASERRVQVEDLYEEYASVQEEIAEVLEQKDKALKMAAKIENSMKVKANRLSVISEHDDGAAM